MLRPTVPNAGMNDELRYKRAVCERIRRARTKAGLTQEQMADLLGVKSRTYQNYEYDRIPWDKLDTIAAETGVEKDWIVTGATGDETTLREHLDRVEGELQALRRLLEGRPNGTGSGGSAP